MNLRAKFLWLPCLSALLAACGSSDAPVAETPVATTTAPNPNAEFTAAVPVGNKAAPARVQFRIGARPATGQPLPVTVRVAPTADVEKLQVFFEVESGLGIVDETQASFTLGATRAGDAHAHELQVLATQDGVHLLKINVMADVATGSSRVSEFAIPILVGLPPPAAPAAPAATPSAAPAAPAAATGG